MLGDPGANVRDPIGYGEIRPAQRPRNQISESLSDQRLDNQSPIRRRVVELAAENDVARDIAAAGSMDAGLMQAIEMALGVVDPRITRRCRIQDRSVAPSPPAAGRFRDRPDRDAR